MRQGLGREILLTVVVVLLAATTAKANFLLPVESMCNYRSLMDDDCVICENVQNFTRDFPMGKGFAPNISDVTILRGSPYPSEVVSVQVTATTDGGATDQLPKSAQSILWGQIAFSMSGGNSWYTNNYDKGTNQHGDERIGTGIPMDFFKHEVLTVKNQGNVRYKQYISVLKPWAVSPEDDAFKYGVELSDPKDTPAPNRWCGLDASKCNKAAYPAPYAVDCPYGFTCPLYDIYPPNTGETAGPWPTPYCDQADGNCNVPGFPEGGGDLLDYFPSLDPDPDTDYPSIPGAPLVRVNGVPAIDCSLYNGVVNEYLEAMGVTASDLISGEKLHPLCDSPVDKDIQAVYDRFGIYAYKLVPGQGMVRFTEALDMLDVVDATFYSADMKVWTAKIDMSEAPFNAQNTVGGSFILHPTFMDTCGNLASGAQSPPYPPAIPGESNEAYVGVFDYYYDQIPTDQDAMKQVIDDDPLTQCSATDTLCPADGIPRDERVECDDPNCECCYNECSPTYCTYNGATRPDVSAQCNPIGDNANPPGCGPEHWGERGMAEIREFKISHSASNLYVKMSVQGKVQFGCYGGWYPVIGCNQWAFGGGEQASKFHGYSWQFLNLETQGTFYLIVIPDIPVYGAIPLFMDLNKLLGELMGSNYDGMELEQYADGGGCKKPGEDEEPLDPCEEIGCTPESNPTGDCDEDGFLNSTDSCPCSAGGDDSEDGCPPPDPDPGGDPLGPYKCPACTIENTGGDLYVEMGLEETLGLTDTYHAMAMFLSVHDLDVDWILYYACLKGYNLTGLAQDQSPRIQYYMLGDVAKTTVTLSQDYTAPKMPMYAQACLGRCDEPEPDPDNPDGYDNDCDLDVVEPVHDLAVDEGYDPTATQIEFSFQEVVSNNDPLKTDLTDLGGYEIQVSRDRDGPYETYYVMCADDAGADCYGRTTTNEEYLAGVVHNRDIPSLDEPYDGTNICSFAEHNTPREVRNRFPDPFDWQEPYSGYGFPGEPISCVIDTDCDPVHNGRDDDLDGTVDEGCWATNCIDDTTQLAADGQSYWFRVRAFDLPKPIDATSTALVNYSDYTEPVGATILRNTLPPAKPDEVAAYAMADGGKAKVVWNPNVEYDMGGYMVYRCPANPLDAVKMTLDGTLDTYCANDDNYRQIIPEIMDDLNGYLVDDGMGYRETGLGTGATATALLSCPNGTDPSTYVNSDGFYIKDDNCNWIESTDDVGVDGEAGTGDLGEGDHVPTPAIPGLYPGEPHAYEWIDCSDLTKNGITNEDLKLCGNIETPGAWFDNSDPLFSSDEVALHLFDVTADPNYDEALHAPVIFYNGLVDGYKYYYKIKAIDAPYLGDGYNDISTTDNCDDGLTAYAEGPPPTGCVNPIEERTCDDKAIAYDWTSGGNCSEISDVMEVIPADTQPPQKPMAVQAQIAKSGKSVTLTWETPVTDRTQDHFNIYRAVGNERLYACVHGGCSTPPYTAGCACDPNSSTQQCNTGYICDVPYKICTNPPYYSVTPQSTGCDSVPYNDGCICTDDSDCNTGMSCTNQYSICRLENEPPGYPLKNDLLDNDGDGVIDEEQENGIDDDADGLIDEDTGERTSTEWKIGECPTPDYPYYSAVNEYLQERIITNSFVDNSIKRDTTYYYRISGVDNAKYDPLDFQTEITDVDPPPPNEGTRSFSIIVNTVDSEAPAQVGGACTHPITHLPMPCADRLDETFATSETSLPVSCANEATMASTDTDMYGNQITVWWYRSSDEDIQGYYIYRAADTAGTGVEPPAGAFEQINQTMIAQTASTGSAQTLCYKDVGLDNNTDYYFSVTAIDTHGNESYLSEVTGPIQAKDTTPNIKPMWGTSVGITSDVNGLKLTLEWMAHVTNCSAYSSPSSCNAVQTCYWTSSCEMLDTEKDFSHFLVYRDEDDNDICDEDELLGSSGTCTTDAQCGSDTCVNGFCCDGSDSCNGELTESTYVDEAVTKGVEEMYCIRAVDENGNLSDLSDSLAATPTDLVAPDAPEGLAATPMSNAQVGLGWKVSSEDDIECYIPYYSTSSAEGSFTAITLDPSDEGYHTVVNLYSETIKCITEPYYIDDDRIAGIGYYFKVAAVDNNGNVSTKSSYAYITPTVTDTTAPAVPDDVYTRPGFDRGESGGSVVAGEDDDGDGFIDDTTVGLGQVEIYWTRSVEPDVENYEIYKLSPPDTADCTCDIENDPNGDCDSDETPNKLDDCPCTPTSANTSQFGSYSLLVTRSAAQSCPSTKGYPVNTHASDICYYKDITEEGVCQGSRYWYAIVPVDENGNSTALNKNNAVAVTPPVVEDTTAPEKPAKPTIAQNEAGTALVVKFTENDMTADDNVDIQGYMIYRDNLPNGSFTTKVAIMNNIDELNYCTAVNQPPCYCDEVDATKACFLDISVVQNKRYYYKVSAFDMVGNISEPSDWNFALASPSAPDAVDTFVANPMAGVDYSLTLFWDGTELLNDPNVAGFMIWRAAAEDGSYSIIDPYPDTTAVEKFRTTTYIDTGLVQGNTYWYMIITESQDGTESPSVKTCGVPGEDMFPPLTPTGLLTTPGNAQVSLAWAANTETDLAGYNVYRATTNEPNAFTKINSATVTQPFYSDTTVTNSTRYYYCVTSYDNSQSFDTQGCYEDTINESACSTVKSATPTPVGVGGSSSRQVVLNRGWNILAVPEIDGTSAGRITPDAARTDAMKNRFFKLSSKAEGYKMQSFDDASIYAGEAMWYYADTDGEVLEYDGELFSGTFFDVNLEKGWNMVGNPFHSAIHWFNGYIQVSTDGGNTFMPLKDAVDSGIVLSAKKYVPDSGYREIPYGESNIVSYFRGFWVNVSQPVVIRVTGSN